MLLHDITRTVHEWIRTERQIHRLRWLDERLLDDMGIARHDIAARVRGRRH